MIDRMIVGHDEGAGDRALTGIPIRCITRMTYTDEDGDPALYIECGNDEPPVRLLGAKLVSLSDTMVANTGEMLMRWFGRREP